MDIKEPRVTNDCVGREKCKKSWSVITEAYPLMHSNEEGKVYLVIYLVYCHMDERQSYIGENLSAIFTFYNKLLYSGLPKKLIN